MRLAPRVRLLGAAQEGRHLLFHRSLQHQPGSKPTDLGEPLSVV